LREDNWDERLGWTHGLVSADPAERTAALEHHLRTRAAVVAATRRFNDHWHRTRADYRDPGLRQAMAERTAAQRYAFPAALWAGPSTAAETVRWQGLPYALNFLEWEARHPEVWTEHAKEWGTKEGLLRRLAVSGHGDLARERLTDLVELVVHRAHRCKDRRYVGVARAVDSADLRARLTAAADSASPWPRLHAVYVLRMLRDPERPNSRTQWLSHVRSEHVPPR
jgi:hypothetical protein